MSWLSVAVLPHSSARPNRVRLSWIGAFRSLSGAEAVFCGAGKDGAEGSAVPGGDVGQGCQCLPVRFKFGSQLVDFVF